MNKTISTLAGLALLLGAAPAFAQTATFTASPQSGPAPLAVTFTANVSDASSGLYSINFGDAQTGNVFPSCIPATGGDACLSVGTASHIYASAGTYIAKLSDNRRDCSEETECNVVGRVVIVVTSGQATAAAKTAAGNEINRRLTALTDMNTKIQAMTYVSAGQKSAIAATVSTEIANLTALKAKIDADTDTATLRTDIASISTDYRIFKLVIPQARVEVAADKVLAAVTAYNTFATQLQSRIATAQTGGKDVSALNASLSDMKAKVADASAQAQAALALVVNLQPDGGNQAVADSNKAALQSASAKLKVANSDLRAARQDAQNIINGLQQVNVALSAFLTVNGSSNVTLNVGNTLNLAWSSTGGTSYDLTYTQDSSSCGVNGTGPFKYWGKATVPASYNEQDPVTDCWGGHTYVITFTAKDAQGNARSSTATVTVAPGPLSASFSVNGSNNVTLHVGDIANYVFNSTGAVSAAATWTQDSTSCNYNGTGPFDFFGTKASATAWALNGAESELVTTCWLGHTYGITYTATDAQGNARSSTANITVAGN